MEQEANDDLHPTQRVLGADAWPHLQENTMMHWMQSPFQSMESVSIDALGGYEYVIFVKGGV